MTTAVTEITSPELEFDEKSGAFKRYIYVRNSDDHWARATVYFRVGKSKFSSAGEIMTLSYSRITTG